MSVLSESEIKEQVFMMGKQARAAALKLASLTTSQKNEILKAMALSLRAATSEIVAANKKDLSAGEVKGLSAAMLDRLRLDSERVEQIAAGVEQVSLLEDPVGEILSEWDRPNGLRFEQLRVPIGVIGIIYESRPNVTSDAAVLCLKSGNATILRGGSEAIHSNRAIASALQSGGEPAGLPAHSIQLIPFTDRASVKVMAEMDQYLDLIIPRGGKGLIETVVSLARMPVIKHYDGICHTYVDSEADLEMAVAIANDAKTQKPSVCNALETLLVHESVAAAFFEKAIPVFAQKEVEWRADKRAQQYLPHSVPAVEEDWHTEYLDYVLSVKVVDHLQEAIDHINHYSSKHSEFIVSQNKVTAETFMSSIDSACLFHNVSTRFSDGEEFGFGAEIGISTDKLHARGPMALRELTSYQYRIRGEGQIKGK